jgi:hypothetical protein
VIVQSVFAPTPSATTHDKSPSLDFELDGVEGGLQEMKVGSVPGDHQLAI